MRVLMIEDDDDISIEVQHIIESVLVDEDASVEIATTLKHADQCLSECVYDAIVLDVSLPDGNGLQWLRNQSAISRQQLPIIVLSASSQVDSIFNAMEFGAAHYLEKSVASLAALPNLIESCVYARQASTVFVRTDAA